MNPGGKTKKIIKIIKICFIMNKIEFFIIEPIIKHL